MLLRCINASNQPRLTQGAIYELLFDVEHSQRPGEAGNKSGYFVKVHDAEMAIPFIYKRSRFVEYKPGEGDDSDDSSED